MEEIIALLMKRDGLDREDAEAEYKDLCSDIRAAVDNNSIIQAESALYDRGLELDYLMNVIEEGV